MALGFHRINSSAARRRIADARPKTGVDHGTTESWAAMPFPEGYSLEHPRFGMGVVVAPGMTSTVWAFADGEREILNKFMETVRDRARD